MQLTAELFFFPRESTVLCVVDLSYVNSQWLVNGWSHPYLPFGTSCGVSTFDGTCCCGFIFGTIFSALALFTGGAVAKSSEKLGCQHIDSFSVLPYCTHLHCLLNQPLLHTRGS